GGVGGAGGQGGDPGLDAGPPAPRFTARHANLRFKSADRLRGDLARALDLPPDGLCNELGQYDCIEAIHKVALGGVEAYRANIYRPFPEPSASAPLIVERVALAACTRRIALDREDAASAVLWGAVPLAGARLADVDGEPVTAALTALYTRALLRLPTAEELDLLRQLYRDFGGAGLEGSPALHWAQAACVAVLTSTEFLFY
ncbi:MAG: hypothetical protein KC549_13610, partial [Myxococcales bacterium]|nr:hypothetical protein [Myxococcales bacterium]